MTKETMTITKALSELKILDSRINNETTSMVFCDTSKHAMRTLKGKSIPDAKAEMQGNYDKITALINRNNAIKKAVTKANASTTISIGEEQMTIAEAIYMKQQGIDHMKKLLNTIASQYNQAQSTIHRSNGDVLTQACEAYIVKLFGSGDGKTVSNEIEAVKKQYLEENTVDLIEGVDTAKVIMELKDKINTFEAEVDAAITVANATTTIEIIY